MVVDIGTDMEGGDTDIITPITTHSLITGIMGYTRITTRTRIITGTMKPHPGMEWEKHITQVVR